MHPTLLQALRFSKPTNCVAVYSLAAFQHLTTWTSFGLRPTDAGLMSYDV